MIERLRVRIPAEAAAEFSSPESTLCADSYSVSVPLTPHVTTVARKRPRPFYRKRLWQVTPKHAYTLGPTKSEWADYAAVQAYCGSLSGNEITHNSSRNTQPQSSQLAEPLRTDPGPKSGISLRELKRKKKKRRRRGLNGRTISQNPRKRGKSHHHHHHHHCVYIAFRRCFLKKVQL